MIANPDSIRLDGKIALVTGASRGIGAGIARVLASRGADVFVNYYQDQAGATQVVEAIRAMGRRGWPARADMRDPNDIAALFELVKRESGALDILVNNAVEPIRKTAMQLTVDEWDHSMNVAARALLLCAQQAMPLMAGRRDPAIIHISSDGAAMGRSSTYCALGVAKAAAESLVRYLAVELASQGINVNTVRAGGVDTAAARTMLAGQAPKPSPSNLLGRLCDPDEVGRIVAFLCTPDAAWIRGQIIEASGGSSI